MSETELSEARSRFDESMKRAASVAKELAIAMHQPLYNKWAFSLDRLRVQGLYMANAKSRSKTEIESDMVSLQDNLNSKRG